MEIFIQLICFNRYIDILQAHKPQVMYDDKADEHHLKFKYI